MLQRLVHLNARTYRIWDFEQSIAADIVAAELSRDVYEVANLPIAPGDVILDIGGHIGLFAIYAATLWPQAQIHSFEPFPPNSGLFERNVASAQVRNVHLHCHAITHDGSPITMVTNSTNSGGATSFSKTLTSMRTEFIPSKTLDDVFNSLGIAECALLKVDCEGAEYQILSGAAEALHKVRHMRAEFHVNSWLQSLGCDPDALAMDCRSRAPHCDLRYSTCRMSD